MASAVVPGPGAAAAWQVAALVSRPAEAGASAAADRQAEALVLADGGHQGEVQVLVDGGPHAVV